LCDDCTPRLIPSPIVDALRHLNSLDNAIWEASPAGGIMQWDGPTRDPEPGDRLAAQVMIVQLVAHYLGKFNQWYLEPVSRMGDTSATADTAAAGVV
jgi:hypothetical protein